MSHRWFKYEPAVAGETPTLVRGAAKPEGGAEPERMQAGDCVFIAMDYARALAVTIRGAGGNPCLVPCKPPEGAEMAPHTKKDKTHKGGLPKPTRHAPGKVAKPPKAKADAPDTV